MTVKDKGKGGSSGYVKRPPSGGTSYKKRDDIGRRHESNTSKDKGGSTNNTGPRLNKDD